MPILDADLTHPRLGAALRWCQQRQTVRRVVRGDAEHSARRCAPYPTALERETSLPVPPAARAPNFLHAP